MDRSDDARRRDAVDESTQPEKPGDVLGLGRVMPERKAPESAENIKENDEDVDLGATRE
jgi:hypothetical protein